MNDQKKNSFLENAGKIGTPECAVFCAAAAMALGVLLLWIGFWKTLFVAVLMALGAFLGGVKEKKQWVKKLLNRIIPEKNTVAYREQHPEIARAVREATEKADDARTDDTEELGTDDGEE